MSKIKLDKVEFYITNVCNLTCDECNRFNNFSFKGWQRWQDYEATYAEWNSRLDIRQLVILGGEPLLNPSICEWITGINRVFSQGVQILTNGTRINQVSGLYQALTGINIRGRSNILSVVIHNLNDTDWFLGEICKFLQEPIKKIVGEENNPFGSAYLFIDKNGVQIPVYPVTDFVKSAIINNGDKLTLHNSDPEIAHGVCSFALNKNYHFIRGNLYKCGPVALLPEFDQQIGLDISDQDRELLNSYQPLTIQNFQTYHQEFFQHLDDPIPQCKFCPSQSDNYKIWAITKGRTHKPSA